AGESLLIDTGWPGFSGRDADRIVAATRKAGLNRVDYVLLTHYHADHAGGAPQLAARIPIGAFIDHGDNRESTDRSTVTAWEAYKKLLASGKFRRITVKPGDVLPLEGMKATVVSSDGAVITKPLPGAGEFNPACKNAQPYQSDQTENLRSVGIFINFGTLRMLDLGDLTGDKEMELMCPNNKLGKVDVYIVSHHGSHQSGSPALGNGIDARIAIMDNGATKGASPSAWDIVRKSPHLEDLWQLHYAEAGGAAHNSANEFLANPSGPDAGNYLLLTAHSNGSFEILNARTQQTKSYA